MCEPLESSSSTVARHHGMDVFHMLHTTQQSRHDATLVSEASVVSGVSVHMGPVGPVSPQVDIESQSTQAIECSSSLPQCSIAAARRAHKWWYAGV